MESCNDGLDQNRLMSLQKTNYHILKNDWSFGMQWPFYFLLIEMIVF